MKKAVVTVYARHRSLCSDAHKGEFYRGCNCPKWLRFSLDGKRHRQPTGTATWGLAEEKAHELQKQLDSGQYGIAATVDIPAPVSNHQTIADAIQTFIRGKESENLSPATIRKLRYQLNLFEQFMTSCSKFYPADITAQEIGRASCRERV